MSLATLLGVGLGAFIFLIIILAIWELIWKGIALWHAAQNKHKGWYVCILIFNTAGILPIIYLLMHKKNKKKK